MKRKTNTILSAIFLLFLCLTVFASCQTQKADYFNYSESNLGLVGKLVLYMHRWIGNYGWTVVVFTFFLKLLMSPLDIWQRVSTRKMTLKNQRLQPMLAEIDRRYGANTQRANEEKNKLYKKEGYSMFSSCLPLIVSMIVFFVMFGGLRNYSTYSSVMNFQKLSGTYFDAYYQAVKEYDPQKFSVLNADILDALADSDNSETPETNEHFLRDNYTKDNVNIYISCINSCINDKTNEQGEVVRESVFSAEENEHFKDYALEVVSAYYTDTHESWLWLQNVWQPDTWASIMPAYNDTNNGFSSGVDMSDFVGVSSEEHYNLIRSAVLKTGSRGEAGTWNGLMILPILSIALSFLSIFISQQMEKKYRKQLAQDGQTSQQQAANNKMMMFLMPAMMAVFGFMYTGAFAIYMVCNYALSILSTVILRVPTEKIVEKSLAKDENKKDANHKADYMR